MVSERHDHRHAIDSTSTQILGGLHGVQFGHRQRQRYCQSLAAAAAAAAMTRSNDELDRRIFSRNDAITRPSSARGADR